MEVIVRNLRIAFPSHQGTVEAVRGVSFTLGQEKLGIVGESGSGKTLTARALLRLLPRQAKLEADRLEFDGIDLLRRTSARSAASAASARASSSRTRSSR